MYGLIIRILLLSMGVILFVLAEWRMWDYVDRLIDSVKDKKED
jgi:hypothetical protein